MADIVEVFDYSDYTWRCLECPTSGTEASWSRTVVASISHMRDVHAVPEERLMTSAFRVPEQRE